MGWKNVKEHYGIKHIVQVSAGDIFIGSGFVPELIRISDGGKTIKPDTTFIREGGSSELEKLVAAMRADPEKLCDLIATPDTFEKSITVYTYEGGRIIECQCEELGWPNVTHDGRLMYENMFSTSKDAVVAWAKRNASAGISILTNSVKDAEQRLTEAKRHLQECQDELAALNAEFPEVQP